MAIDNNSDLSWQATRQIYNVTVIPLVSTASSGLLTLMTAVQAWYLRISQNRCFIRVDVLPHVSLRRNHNEYAGAGGMGAPPSNSQGLITHVLECMEQSSVQRLGATDRVLIITGGAFRPHTWRLPARGLRYSVLPSNASFGAVAHELGHLLFDWPDLVWEKSLGQYCLMSLGALTSKGQEPSPPCAPLRMDQGWIDPIVIDRTTRVEELETAPAGTIDWQQNRMLVEHRRQESDVYLLIYKLNAKRVPPRILGGIKLNETDHSRHVLGCIAAMLRSRSMPAGPLDHAHR